MNAPMVIPNGGHVVSAEEIRDHVNMVQKVMQSVMKKDTHYGIVPGSKKPSLYKPGAETLCKTFHINPSFYVEDLSTSDSYRYRVKCKGTHQGSATELGEGVGACSSNEEKYKWRRAICPEEFEEAPEGRRRVKYSKYQGNVERTQQIRAEPDDIDNTVLKMACKRALVAMTLNVLAASDIFAQDIEDLPDHLRSEEFGAGETIVTAPYINAEQAKELTALIETSTLSVAEFCATGAVAKVEEVAPENFESAKRFLNKRQKPAEQKAPEEA